MSYDADVIIVGAGPAGLSAALVLARACRTVLVFDTGRPRNAAARHIHGYLSRDGVPPLEFLRLARAELGKYDAVRIEDREVTQARCEPVGFAVTLAGGRTCRSRMLVIATGVVDNVPGIAGLQELYGRSVFHCPYCDAWEFRGREIGVYGRGMRGYGLSLEMLGWSRDVVLCTDGDAELDDTQRATLASNGILLRDERIVRLDGRDGVLENVVFETGDKLQRRVLFFTTGQHQAAPLARILGCEFNEKGTVRTGRHETTTVPGLYVVGDASHDVQWVIVAAAEGAEAAYAISQELIKAGIVTPG